MITAYTVPAVFIEGWFHALGLLQHDPRRTDCVNMKSRSFTCYSYYEDIIQETVEFPLTVNWRSAPIPLGRSATLEVVH